MTDLSEEIQRRLKYLSDQELLEFNRWFMASDAPIGHMESCWEAWAIASGVQP